MCRYVSTSFGTLLLLLRQLTSTIGLWNRPPTFLLVDYYNAGNGSVFEVAARMNNVSQMKGCCSKPVSFSEASPARPVARIQHLVVFVLAIIFLIEGMRVTRICRWVIGSYGKPKKRSTDLPY